ncbi:MAG TPA: hypothetical protein ENJ95_03640 [Bacteroidetes bacterium]|nr:hypothetical protein [Bacteroidota bacterium]
MQIILDVKSASELWALLQYLRSLSTVKIILPPKGGTPKSGTDGAVPEKANGHAENHLRLVAELEESNLVAVADDHKKEWDFNRFYGAAKTGLTLEQIDAKLNELRSGWELDTY